MGCASNEHTSTSRSVGIDYLAPLLAGQGRGEFETHYRVAIGWHGVQQAVEPAHDLEIAIWLHDCQRFLLRLFI